MQIKDFYNLPVNHFFTMKHAKKITFSTYITLLRLCLAPVMVPFFIVHYLPMHNYCINVAVAALFLFFGFTDFLDGFFARRYHQTTLLGATLDHLADKFLICSALVGLLAINKISYIWVLLLIGRELFMMGLREVALESGVHIQVSSFGKIKTCVQIACIGWIIVDPIEMFDYALLFNYIDFVLLCASSLLAWYSAMLYFLVFYRSLQK